MNAFLEVCFKNNRAVFACFIFFLLGGWVAFQKMPREATPDIDIPVIYVTVSLEGVSPEDAERLLLKPLEKELKRIEGVKEMSAQAVEGMASVTLEFVADFDKNKALEDVRAAVQLAEADLPDDAKRPIVHEVSFANFPVLIVGLSGAVPEATLIRTARALRDKIETIPSVLAVDIGGDREDLIEVLIEPAALEYYDLRFEAVLPLLQRNNKLVSSGTWDIGKGRMPFKIPGIYKNVFDILHNPIKVGQDSVLEAKDLFEVKRTFKDPESMARINGHPTKALYIKKRAGENIIETVQAIKALIEEERPYLSEAIHITYMQDESRHIQDMLRDLQNNLILAMILVMLVVGCTLGLRSTLLVGLAVPGSFLMGLFFLHLGGVTINNVVLFSLILSIGMLVDGAIIVTEFADRKMLEGMPRGAAYLLASQRMILPVIGSTLTTIAAFLPMLFWPGTVGKFLRYLPITVNCILLSSLVVALIFMPVLGALIGRPGKGDEKVLKRLSIAERGDILSLGGLTGWYVRILKLALDRPLRVLGGTVLLFVIVVLCLGIWGKGVEFFPSVEPERINVYVRARGNLSIFEIAALTEEVEARIRPLKGIKNIYTEAQVSAAGRRDIPADACGVLEIEFTDWQTRPKAQEIIDCIKTVVADVPGVITEVRKEQAGPRGLSKPIQLQLSSPLPELVEPALKTVLAKMEAMDGLIDIEDTRSLPGIEWVTEVDRSQASLYGADIQSAGAMVRLITNGYVLSKYRPDDADDEVDIVLRYPDAYRTISQWKDLRLNTPKGQVPLSEFVTFKAAPKTGVIRRTEGRRTLTAYADTAPGVLPNDKVGEMKDWLRAEQPLDARVKVEFKGEDEDQKESAQFLLEAFLVALALIALILITQFNSYYDTLLILTGVVVSTIGVMIGLLLTRQPFGIIMNGIGVVSLAGVVVNNNIVLIDTYRYLRREGLPVLEAILRTGAQRLRPVMLTGITTILGVVPMAIGLNINFMGSGQSFITFGDPSTQWWKQLSVSIAYGLTFAQFLTLIFTPVLLFLGDKVAQKLKQ